MLVNRIHITGASGSGTSTLGQQLADKLSFKHFDTDDYFWMPTNPPFQIVRDENERKQLFKDDMIKYSKWVSSGSSCGWCDFAKIYYDCVIFLYVPHDIRIQRLYDREKERSPDSFVQGTIRHKQFQEFIDWAKRYDTAGDEIRSLSLHNNWLQTIECPVLRIEGEQSVDERLNLVLEFIDKKQGC